MRAASSATPEGVVKVVLVSRLISEAPAASEPWELWAWSQGEGGFAEWTTDRRMIFRAMEFESAAQALDFGMTYEILNMREVRLESKLGAYKLLKPVREEVVPAPTTTDETLLLTYQGEAELEPVLDVPFTVPWMDGEDDINPCPPSG